MNKERYYRHTSPMMLLGCSSCSFFSECGGSFRNNSGLNCFDSCQGCKTKCDFVCPLKPIDFVKSYREVGGFNTQDINHIYQNASTNIPTLIPTIYDNSSLSISEGIEIVAIPTFIFFKFLNDNIEKSLVYKKLGIDENIKIMLSTIGIDKRLETLWAKIDRIDFFSKLSKLNISHIISPNFSFFLDAPRTDNLHNRKRSLICAQEMSDIGLSTIPYLMGITDHDWRFWATFLNENTNIKFVSKELQTGGRNKEVAIWHLNKLVKLQDSIKRSLHPIILGGAKYVNLLKKNFDNWTIISSSIYMKTVNRQMALIIDEKLKWESCNSVELRSISDLFVENFNTCNNWLINKSKIS